MSRALNETQWVVQISGYNPPKPIYFSGKSGGEKTASSTKYNDGVNRVNKKIVSNFDISDLALTRAYEPEIDELFISFLDTYCNEKDGDLVVTVQAIDNCSTANPIGRPFVYSGVQFIGYASPEVKRDGDAAAMITYNFCADSLDLG